MQKGKTKGSQEFNWALGVVLALMAVASLCGGYAAINQKLGLSEDNIIEENLEELIKDRLGIEIDLTPESKE